MKQNDKDINNQSNKPEKFEPQDSKRKRIKHPNDDDEAVVKPEDQTYKKENPEFRDPQTTKAEREQPITSVDEKPNQ